MRALPGLSIALAVSLAAGTTTPLLSSSAAAGTQCMRGWSGSVTYTRRMGMSGDQSVTRVSGNGTEARASSSQLNYTAHIALRDLADPSRPNGLARIAMNAESSETKSANDRHACPHQKGLRTMTGSFADKSRTEGSASGVETDVGVSLYDDGRYAIGVSLPEIRGTVAGSSASSFGGQCSAREDATATLAPTPVTIEGYTFGSSGNDRFDTGDPDRLSGRHSQSEFGVTETLQWNLRRCGGTIRLVDVKFEDMKVPVWGSWQEVSPQQGTIDGNIVRLSAVVANDGPEAEQVRINFLETFDGDAFNGLYPDASLGAPEVTIPSGEERRVDLEWDTSGYAWFDDGRPRLTQRIKVVVEDGGKKVDEKVEQIKIAPKPVILVHGLWSNWTAWESWQNILTLAHSYDWRAFPVGQNPQFGKMSTGEEVGNLGPTKTIAQNAEELERYIKYAQRDRNAWHVDIVAHSLGGLISRRYISATMPVQPDKKPLVSNLVMLGTPNQGSRCADMMSAPLEAAGRSMDALRELRPSVVAAFNAANGERKGTHFAVLAGDPMPAMCYMFEANDGVVTVSSAHWTIADTARAGVIHTALATPETFAAFVRPRLALGPKKQRSEGPLAARLPGASTRTRLLTILSGDKDPESSAIPPWSRLIALRQGQAVGADIPVHAAAGMGMTVVAPVAVAATLYDPQGRQMAHSAAHTSAAAQPFRALTVEGPLVAGTWRLVLENTSASAQEALAAAWFRD